MSERKSIVVCCRRGAVDDSDVFSARQIDDLIIAQILPEALEFTNASATVLPTLSFVCTHAYRKR